MATTTRSRSSQAKQHGGVTINSNTILGVVSTIIGGVVLYMVTTGMGKVSQTSNDVRDVKTVLPFMQHAIDTSQADIKEVKNTTSSLITRKELEDKHAALQSSIRELKTESHEQNQSIALEIKDVKTEQTKVREDLMKQMPPKP